MRYKTKRILVKEGKKFKILRKYLEDNFIQVFLIHEGNWVIVKSNYQKNKVEQSRKATKKEKEGKIYMNKNSEWGFFDWGIWTKFNVYWWPIIL